MLVICSWIPVYIIKNLSSIFFSNSKTLNDIGNQSFEGDVFHRKQLDIEMSSNKFTFCWDSSTSWQAIILRIWKMCHHLSLYTFHNKPPRKTKHKPLYNLFKVLKMSSHYTDAVSEKFQYKLWHTAADITGYISHTTAHQNI